MHAHSTQLCALVQIYDFGSDAYDGLGDGLDEGGADELNDDTFGDGPVGKDFDFGHAGPSRQQADFSGFHRPEAPYKSAAQKPAAASSLAWSIDSDPLLGPKRAQQSVQRPMPPSIPAPSVQAALPAQAAPTAQYRTLEEIEAELRANKSPAPAPQPPRPDVAAPAPRTLEEIEAEMLRNRAAPAPAQAAPIPSPLVPTAPPPHLQQAPQAVMSPPSQGPLAGTMQLSFPPTSNQHFPPLGAPLPPAAQQRQQQLRMGPTAPLHSAQSATRLPMTQSAPNLATLQSYLAMARAQNADAEVIKTLEARVVEQAAVEAKIQRRNAKILEMVSNALLSEAARLHFDAVWWQWPDD